MNGVFSKMQLRQIFTLLMLVITLLFAGCEKNKDSEHFIKYKVNGILVTWKIVEGNLGPHQTTMGKTSFIIKSWDPDHIDAFDIFLEVNGNDLGTGTYTNTTHSLVVDYKLNAHEPSELKFGLHQASGRPAPQFSITLTSIADGELRGTFTGNYLSVNGSNNIVEITDGEFIVPNVR